MPDSAHPEQLKPYVETSWEIIPHTLRYVTNDDKKIVARMHTDLVYRLNGKIVSEDHFNYSTPPRVNIEELGASHINNLVRYYLPAGRIFMEIRFTDLSDPGNTYSSTDSFDIAAPASGPFFSNLQLLDTFFDYDKESVFSKNNQIQIPLNGCFLNNDKRKMHYYAELYHPEQLGTGEKLKEHIYLSKKPLGSSYQFFEAEDSVPTQGVGLIIGSFDISSLLSGNYYLNAAVENKYHHVLTATSLFFQRVNKNPSKEDTIRKIAADTGLEHVTILDLNKTFVSKFNLDQLRAILRMMQPIVDASQANTINGFLERPDEMYTRYFIYNYFSSLNKANPAKAWKDYSEKVMEVNRLFRGGGKQGYQTEQGFYYLRYGPPTEMITVDNEPGTLPYVIWRYNVIEQTDKKKLTNAIFLFYKPNPAIDDYILLHCTVGGELQNNNWRNSLYTNSANAGGGSNKIEEYLNTPR